MSDTILIHDEAGVRTLRMNRTDKKNALTGEMYTRLADALNDANADDSIGATLILGASGVFCAGNDIRDFMGFAMGGSLGTPVLAFLDALASNEKPLIAGVDGAAIGVGTTMLLHCDFVLASGRSTFSTPFIDLGLVPEAASSLLVPSLMGPRLAFEMLAMGVKFDAARAASAGLINHVVSADELEAQAIAAAKSIAAKPREATRLARKLIRPDVSTVKARIAEEAELFKARLRSPEARAAFEAFLSKSGSNSSKSQG